MLSKSPQRQKSKPSQKCHSQAHSQLAATGYAALQNVHCEAQEDLLILSGTVPSYYLKQVAQTVAGNMEGINRIENRLEVRSPR